MYYVSQNLVLRYYFIRKRKPRIKLKKSKAEQISWPDERKNWHFFFLKTCRSQSKQHLFVTADYVEISSSRHLKYGLPGVNPLSIRLKKLNNSMRNCLTLTEARFSMYWTWTMSGFQVSLEWRRWQLVGSARSLAFTSLGNAVSAFTFLGNTGYTFNYLGNIGCAFFFLGNAWGVVTFPGKTSTVVHSPPLPVIYLGKI